MYDDQNALKDLPKAGQVEATLHNKPVLTTKQPEHVQSLSQKVTWEFPKIGVPYSGTL